MRLVFKCDKCGKIDTFTSNNGASDNGWNGISAVINGVKIRMWWCKECCEADPDGFSEAVIAAMKEARK